MIQLQQVSKLYGETAAVSQISFEVQEGENLVLLGTSGCGKTTTLRMINRLTEPSRGKIIVNGKDILQQSPEKLRTGIGYVLQHNGLFPHYTVAENIALVPGLLKWNKGKTDKRVDELLNKLHLSPGQYAQLYPGQLSGGQQQRVGLARALAADPPILLMDEPFGALDPVTRTTIRKEFSQLEEFKKKTIVLVTHDVQEAFELGDRICLMDKGKVVQIGTPADLLFKPATGFVQSFFNDNRLILELQAIRLQEVFDELPEGTGYPSENKVSGSLNLWNVLQLLSENDKSGAPSALALQKNSQVKQITISTLMAAYSNFKTKAAHE